LIWTRQNLKGNISEVKEKTSCLVCKKINPDRAHVKTRGSGGGDEEWNIMPLCREHHVEQHKIGIVTFAEKYKAVKAYLEKHGWTIIEDPGRKKLVRSQAD
jgi:5-methylcytosine-specific restriction endonuclease McrA